VFAAFDLANCRSIASPKSAQFLFTARSTGWTPRSSQVRIEESQTGLSPLRYWGEDAARLHGAVRPTQREAD
jgi:hypothetical protein